MTRLEIMQFVRHLLDEYGNDWLKDSALTYDLGQAVQYAYEQYAMNTKCFPISYTKAATVGTHTYALSTINAAASRIFDLTHIAFNSKALENVSERKLQAIDPDWRFAANGTPIAWMRWGTASIRLYKPPDSTSNIYIEGHETPDPTTFDGDNDVPAIDICDHELLGYGAAVVIALRNPSAENQVRSSPIYQKLMDGYNAAHARIHGEPNPIIVGGGALGVNPVNQTLQQRIQSAL